MRLLFFRGKNLISKIIKTVTWGSYSHVAALIDDQTVSESWVKSGVRKIRIDDLVKYHTPGTLIDVFQISKCVPEIIKELMLAEVGKKYHFIGILGFILHKNLPNPQCWFCSELIAWSLAASGFPLLNRQAHKISPSLLVASPYLKYERSFKI